MRRRRPGWASQCSRKASTTARLTKAGIWRAAQLGVPYSPGLVDTLIAESEKPAPHSRAEKQRVAEIDALVADGQEYRRQIAARKTAKDDAAKAALVGPRRKRSARHYEKLNKFLVSRGMQPTKVSAFGNGSTFNTQVRAAVTAYEAQRPKAASRHPQPSPVAPTPAVLPARPRQDDSFAAELDRIQNRVIASLPAQTREFTNLPKPEDVSNNARILARFQAIPVNQFPGELQPGGKTIMYDGRIYSLVGWEKVYFAQSK